MQLRSKYYTYPVISEDGEYYVDSLFETDVEKELIGYDIKFIFKVKLENKQLEQMLKDERVIIVHHIECPQTCYRTIIRTKEYNCEAVIQDSKLNGSVQICTFLIANEDIKKYSNDNFSSDYRGFKFDIDKGCVMAIGNQINFIINKIKDDLANTSSIFSVIPNLDSNIRNMHVDLTGAKIVISLPEEAFGIYRNMSSVLDVQQTMHSMIIVPALEYVFSELRDAKEQLYEFEDRRWYRSLCKACEKLGITINEQSLSNIDILFISQLLINNPIVDGLKVFVGAEEINED